MEVPGTWLRIKMSSTELEKVTLIRSCPLSPGDDKSLNNGMDSSISKLKNIAFML